MKYNAKSSANSIRFFVLLASAICELSALAATPTTWTGAFDHSNWFNDQNWSDGAPNFSKDAYINNGDKVLISGASASARSLTLGLSAENSGGVEVAGPGASLVLPSYATSNDFPIDGAIYVGYYGRGALSITNGGTVSCGFGWIAALGAAARMPSNGVVTVDGIGSSWTVNGGGPNLKLCVGCIGAGQNAIDGGTGLLSITSGGNVIVGNNGASAAWVGTSGTLTGNESFTASNGSDNGRLLVINGTLAPTKSLKINANLGLDPSANAVCDLTPEDINVINVPVGGRAFLEGRLTVTMTGAFTAGTRFALLHADGGISPDTTFRRGVSIKYPTREEFTPVIEYDYDTNNVYLYLEPPMSH